MVWPFSFLTRLRNTEHRLLKELRKRTKTSNGRMMKVIFKKEIEISNEICYLYHLINFINNTTLKIPEKGVVSFFNRIVLEVNINAENSPFAGLKINPRIGFEILVFGKIPRINTNCHAIVFFLSLTMFCHCIFSNNRHALLRRFSFMNWVKTVFIWYAFSLYICEESFRYRSVMDEQLLPSGWSEVSSLGG